ncbi:MAG TPA: hypothetical protein VGE97_05675, partial [Nitrososphaera sp.]
MRPWVHDDKWFDKYARASASIKLSRKNAAKAFPQIREAISAAFTQVYRAVAFDVDGTLTEKNKGEIDVHMALVVGRLLQRGVPVVLITGRGRTWSRKAALEIKQFSGLSDWYFRRLQCITHNGVFLLQTPTISPAEFMNQVELISPGVDNFEDLVREVRQIISQIRHLTSQEVELTREPQSLRLSFKSAQDRNIMEDALQVLVKSLSKEGSQIYLSRGSYADISCLDIAATNKKIALERFAAHIGVNTDKILRIGDQGQEGGNDFDLLDTPFGFSVGQLSSKPSCCHPVFDDNFKIPLVGALATERLLDLVLLFPPLSIAHTPVEDRLKALRDFEKLAVIRSREEIDAVTQRLRVRLRNLLPDSGWLSKPRTLESTDIYDQLSGGVKFRDWELDSIPENHPGRDLFETRKLQPTKPGERGSSWCMYTDTGILMRGPSYYYGMTALKKEREPASYLELAKTFVTAAAKVIGSLISEEGDLARYKLVLAIQDNIRNILLQLLYMTFVVEGMNTANTYASTRQLYHECVSPHTKQHYDFLLNPDSDWANSLHHYQNLLLHLENLIQHLKQWFSFNAKNNTEEADLFKWRECDNFLQNLAAV